MTDPSDHDEAISVITMAEMRNKWMGGRYARSKSAGHFAGLDRNTVINDLRQFYREAEGGIFRRYLPDFERAVRESM